jgi:hypothetical protein
VVIRRGVRVTGLVAGQPGDPRRAACGRGAHVSG